MEEFTKPLKITPDQEIRIQKQQKQEFKLLGSFVLRPGLRVYSLNTKTGIVEEVKLEKKVTINIKTGKPEMRTSVFTNAYLIYLQCLNKKIAIKKFIKIIGKNNNVL
jgi:hypothetical protein